MRQFIPPNRKSDGFMGSVRTKIQNKGYFNFKSSKISVRVISACCENCSCPDRVPRCWGRFVMTRCRSCKGPGPLCRRWYCKRQGCLSGHSGTERRCCKRPCNSACKGTKPGVCWVQAGWVCAPLQEKTGG